MLEVVDRVKAAVNLGNNPFSVKGIGMFRADALCSFSFHWYAFFLLLLFR